MPNRVIIWAITLLLVLGACSPDQRGEGERALHTVQDDLGRSIACIPRPQRLVSLAPSITEMVFALGLGERLVGVTTYCDYPPEAQAITKIGDTIHPSLERILAVQPDLVIASRISQLEAFAHRLEQMGVPLYVVDARRLDDIPRSMRRLGEVLGEPERAATVTRAMEERMREIERRVAGRSRPRTLLVVQPEPLMVPGTKTYLADLIRRAGGIPLGPDDPREGVTYSLEAVIAAAPEVIIVPEPGARQHRLEHIEWPGLAETPAARRGAVYVMDADLISRPGPRVVEGLAIVAGILHPEAFDRGAAVNAARANSER
ncbi:MAG: cobalamin-binding protein [Acidobacteria bacterium]|nr:MAG: cobalamin-binding protein [Acidobacteriota bacterium]